MAEVLLARASGIEGFTRHVVVKKIRQQLTKDQAFVQMFLNEARLAAQLHHANIVQVHDIGQEGHEYFFAMEYVHGEDVRRLLTQLARRKEKIPFEHAVTIISAAAVALHHAHEQLGSDRKPLGIVHRDVTPANIIVGYDGNVKVVDFGIAKAVASSTEDTQAGTLKGKASYMSPEQCTGGTVDRRSDVFALGIVLYELITTRRLFKADNDFLTMSAIVSGKVPSARNHRPDLPGELERIIIKALAVKPEHRYQTADEMRAALEAFAEHARLRMSTSALATYMKQQFGERPEPWLVDDEEVEMEMTVDFDGSASGMAPAPRESVDGFAIPQSVQATGSSAIMKARTKAITGQPTDKPRAKAAQIPPQAIKRDPSRPIKRENTPVPGVAPPKLPSLQIPQMAAKAADSGAVPRNGPSLESGATTLVVDSDSPAVKVITGNDLDIAPKVPIQANGKSQPIVMLVPRPDGTPMPALKKTDDGDAAETDLPPPPIGSTPVKIDELIPEAWPGGSSAVSTRSKRARTMTIAGCVIAALAAIVIVLLLRGHNEPAPAPQPAPQPSTPAPVAAPAPLPAPEPAPVAAPPQPEVAVEQPAEPPKKKPVPKKTLSRPAVQKPPASGSAKKWDPNSLFYKK